MTTFSKNRTRNTGGRSGTVSARPSTRSTGTEIRALAWLARHPGFWALPALLGGAVYWWGPVEPA